MDVPCVSAKTFPSTVCTASTSEDLGAIRHRASVGSPNLEAVREGRLVSAVTAMVSQRAN